MHLGAVATAAVILIHVFKAPAVALVTVAVETEVQTAVVAAEVADQKVPSTNENSSAGQSQ